ncbi:MAG TPA: nuclear transport factor 2 family protein [Acidimicrobiales bacterium]|nr:nuclear transport factor 2 family protein [Acidimicrobiales bacterium]
MTTPIERCLDAWHGYLRSKDPDALDALLHDNVVFWSPIVFKPQRGRDLTKLYLTAAAGTLVGEAPADSPGEGSDPGGGFRYVRKIHQGNDALLEFETTMAGKYVNGVDLITCDDDGLIVDFKVLIRPLQAVNIVHDQMRAMIESMSPSP